MITDREKWHYLAVKSLSMLFHRIVSTHNDGLLFANCFHLLRTEGKLKSYQNVRKNHDYCNLKMTEALKKILKFTQNYKFLKIP